jgi:hypothetical protein
MFFAHATPPPLLASLPAPPQCLSQLTALSTLRLLPRDHGVGGLDKLVPLRLKQLKLR